MSARSSQGTHGLTQRRHWPQVYNWLPLAHCLNGVERRVLCMHGGLFSRDDVTLDDIRRTERNRQPPEEGIMCELLWSDPQPMKGRSPSKRVRSTTTNPTLRPRPLPGPHPSMTTPLPGPHPSMTTPPSGTTSFYDHAPSGTTSFYGHAPFRDQVIRWPRPFREHSLTWPRPFRD